MSIPLADLLSTLTKDEILASLIAVAAQLKFPVTAYQSGQPANTIYQASASQMAAFSLTVQTVTSGGFLDYAATVTLDPAVVGDANWSPGWLDALASSVYNVSDGQGGIGRFPATYAPGTQTFTNTGAPQGPFAPRTFHVSNGTNTYSNTSTFTIGTGTTTNVPFSADVIGAGGTAAPGTVTQLVTTLVGVTTTNPQSYVGRSFETNAQLVTRCRSKLGSLSPNGPASAYDYVSKTIPLPNELVPLSSGPRTIPSNPVTRTKQVVTPQLNLVTNYVANANGPYIGADVYTGSATLAVTAINNASVPTITTTLAHGYNSGDNIYITNTGTLLDGQVLTATVTGPFTFTVPLPSGGTSSTGGVYRVSDLDLIDKTVQTYAVPLGVVAVNVTAPGRNIVIAGTIYLKKASTLLSTAAISQAQTAIAAYFPTIPLGGDDLGGGAHFFLRDPMQRAIANAMPNDVLQVTLSSPAADVAVTTPQDVATISGTPAFTVVRET